MEVWAVEHVIALCGASWDDIMYPMIGALVVLIIGFAIVMKGGSKYGWIFIAAAVVWAYMTMKPVMDASRRNTVGQPSSTPYLNVPKQK